MKIHLLEDESGKLHAFEVDNWKVSRERATKIVGSVSGTVVTRKPKRIFSWFREEVFCEFELNGVVFQIDEPYGDNSRYWIGIKETGGWCKELELVKQAFQASW